MLYNNTISVKTDRLVRSQKIEQPSKIVDIIIIGIGNFRILYDFQVKTYKQNSKRNNHIL